jgi:hypothetical protein
LVSSLSTLACDATPPTVPQQRPIVVPADHHGWARVELDAAAQREREFLWLSDGEGRPNAFLFESGDLWQSRELEITDTLYGTDESGRLSAEFRPRLPSGWQLGEREHLAIEVEVESSPTFVAQVQVQRRRENGEWLRLDQTFPFYDLGVGNHRKLSIPWDGDHFRLRFEVSQGEIRSIRQLNVRAQSAPESSAAILVLAQIQPPRPGSENAWIVSLAEEERIVGLELELAPPVAPIAVRVFVPQSEGGETRRLDTRFDLANGSYVWDLPALSSRSNRVSLAPIVTNHLAIEVPSEVKIERVKALVSREKIIFPALPAATYYLHQNGELRQAPGDLRALPDSRIIHQTKPLALGAAQNDPHGVAREATTADKTRPWLVWIVAALVALLAFLGFRLLRSAPKPNA